jgi:hypothetical protein
VKSVRRRGKAPSARKKEKSHPQSVDEQNDDSENDEQKMTNVVTDETEQRGRKNKSSKHDADKRPKVTVIEGSDSPWVRERRSSLDEERYRLATPVESDPEVSREPGVCSPILNGMIRTGRDEFLGACPDPGVVPR